MKDSKNMVYCNHCGAKNNEDVKFCANCGNKIYGATNAKSPKEKFLTLAALAFIILGVIAFIMGSNLTYYGSYESTEKYGGDAYTGMQNAAAKTANNVNSLAETYRDSYSMFMTFLGITMVTSGVLCMGYNIMVVRKEEN